MTESNSQKPEAVALCNAAEQFLAIVNDGNLIEMQDYLASIFGEALGRGEAGRAERGASQCHWCGEPYDGGSYNPGDHGRDYCERKFTAQKKWFAHASDVEQFRAGSEGPLWISCGGPGDDGDDWIALGARFQDSSLVDAAILALEFLEAREDVCDGADSPRPNEAMRIAMALRQALDR